MKRLFFSISILVPGFLFLLSSCSSNEEIRLDSPEGKSSIQFILSDGKPYYRVFRDQRLVIDTSAMGFELQNDLPLLSGFTMENASMSSLRERWEPAWGQNSLIRNYSHQLLVVLREKSEPYREMHLEFKAYDDGVAFRYIFPEQEDLKELEITNEMTTFRFAEDMNAWWLPGNGEEHDLSCRNTPLHKVDFANTPLTLEADDSLFVSLHEAALVDYPEIRLKKSEKNPLVLNCELAGEPDSAKARVQLPFSTPWRTIQLFEKAGKLIEYSFILNLNAPAKIEDVSWIRPLKNGDKNLIKDFEVVAMADQDEDYFDSVFTDYEQQGIQAVKMKPGVEMQPGEHSLHGQWMMNHYARIIEKAAQHKIMVYAPESFKSTGLEKTWPNFMGSARVYGHEIIPGDREHSTLARHLALMVVIYSPCHLLDPLAEEYKDHPAHDFIRELPADWDETLALSGKIGEYITMARKKKDTWYVGSVNDDNPRELAFMLDFLDEKLSYEAISYVDGPDADGVSNPGDYIMEKKPVKKDDEMLVRLAAGGGQAVIIKPID